MEKTNSEEEKEETVYDQTKQSEGVGSSTLGRREGWAEVEVREVLPRRGEVQIRCKGQEGCWQDWPRADIDPLPTSVC